MNLPTSADVRAVDGECGPKSDAADAVMQWTEFFRVIAGRRTAGQRCGLSVVVVRMRIRASACFGNRQVPGNPGESAGASATQFGDTHSAANGTSRWTS